MKYITLTQEQDDKWLEYLKNDRAEFLSRLLKKLKNDNNTKLILSNRLLRELVIERKPVNGILNDNDEYIEMQDTFTDIDSWNLLNSICAYLDFRNLEYHDLKFDNDTITYLKRYNIPINPSRLYKKSLQGYTFDNCTFVDSFDDCDISYATIRNCKDISGRKIEINPQKIKDKRLEGCILTEIKFTGSFDECNIDYMKVINCDNIKINPQNIKEKSFFKCNLEGVEFIDSFEGCNIREMKLKNCKNAKINPQNVDDKSLYSCELEDVEFTGGFDDCRIAKMSIKNCKNAKINPQKVFDRHLCGCVFNGVEFTDSIDNCELKDVRFENVSNLHVNAENLCLPPTSRSNHFYLTKMTIYVRDFSAFNIFCYWNYIYCDKTTKIVCNSKDINRLKSIDVLRECTFLTMHSEMDDFLDEVFSENNITTYPENTSVKQYNITTYPENTSVKKKKKSIFDRFRK